LDKYLNALSLRQAHFLYRNIPYIQRNAGKCEIFDLLVEHFITARNIPLDEYVAKHVSTNMPDGLLPDVVFKRVPLNYTPSHLNDIVVTIDEVFNKEAGLARDNSLYQEDYLDEATHAFKISLADTVDTKLLSSDVIDYSNSDRYQLSDLLVANWLHLSRSGLYTAVISCTNPATAETYLLRADEAYTLMWYLFHGALGITLEYIPDMLAERVIRDDLTGVDQMLSAVEEKWRDYLRPTLIDAKSLLPLETRCISVDAFYKEVSLICNAMNAQELIVAFEQHVEARVQLVNAINKLYMDRVYSPDSPTIAYSDWLSERNIYITGLTQDQFSQMYAELLKNGTGLNGKNGITIRDIQKAMLNLMADLSSYSIQFTSTSNSSSIISSNIAAVRPGDATVSGAGSLVAPSHGLDIMNHTESVTSSIRIDPGDGVEVNVRASLNDCIRVELVKLVSGKISYNQTYRIELGVWPTAELNPIPYENGVVNVLGMDLFVQLSNEKREAILEYIASQNP
jgi:hypothetical protein